MSANDPSRTFRHRRRDRGGARIARARLMVERDADRAGPSVAQHHILQSAFRATLVRQKATNAFHPLQRDCGMANYWMPRALVGQIGAIMKVAEILRIKGSVVKTVPPHETALLASGHLRAEQIGARVVSTDGNAIDGIISERDLACGLASHRERLPTIRISELMTRAVIVCSPEDSVTAVMKLMTQHRTRHVPVERSRPTRRDDQYRRCSQDRLGELQEEADVLRDYAVAARR